MSTKMKAFLPGHEKIHLLDVHPTQPWVVTADEADSVVVWDWEHRQILYQVNAAGVDVRRVIDTQLQKLAGESDASSGAEGLKGGSVKYVKFYDDDIRFWTAWKNRAAASELSIAASSPAPPIGPGPAALRGRRFLVTCSTNKAVFLDLVTMKARDVPKAALDNKAPLCVEFLPRTTGAEGPFAAFGGPDGAIRVLSMSTWQPFKRLSGGHKNAVSCMLTYATSQGETQLVTGGSDGSLVFWNLDSGVSTVKDGGPKLALNKVHDGGVLGISLARIVGAAPQLITTGADKSLAIWDTLTLKEMRRIKQTIGKLPCHSVCAWSHPRAPTFESLVAGKDPNLWGVERGTGARPLVDLNKFVPPSAVPQGKKLKIYSMLVHPLQPQLVIMGTNAGIALLEFDSKAIPPATALPTPSGGKEHTVVYTAQRELRALTFSLGAAGTAPRADPVSPTKAMAGGAAEAVRQSRKRLASALHEENARLAASPSGKYVSVRWPGQNSFAIYSCRNWSIVDSGAARFFAWDTVRDRYSLLPAVTVQAPQLPTKGSSKKKAEAAAAAQAAAAAAAAAAASATVEVREIVEDGAVNLLCKAIDGRKEPVTGLQGGALLGVSYRITVARERLTSAAALMASAQGAYQAAAAGGGVAPSSAGGGPDENSVYTESPPNFQLYSWESFKPVSGLLPQPEWSAWDAGVEYCALVYKAYVVICAARPSFRSLGSVAIAGAVSGMWHRRQFFVATPTTIEVVFVDGGIDPEEEEKRRKKKQEEENKKAREKVDPNTLALAVLTVDAPQTAAPKSTLKARPPLLQVVRLASFATPPAAPAVSKPKVEETSRSPLSEIDGSERKPEVAIAGGGQSAAPSRLPPEQRRPVGPLVVVGVREGVLWLVDRYFTAHAIALSHAGIRCRCLAAYGDAVSAVKWAARLGREHHDDLATFMVGMGYAKEALHLPGLSKRLEFDLAMQCNELQRALRVLLELSSSKEAPPEPMNQTAGLDVGLTLLALEQKQASLTEAVAGTARFATEFLAIIDAADATGQKDIALAALKRLAVAGEVEGALKPKEHRALSLRLASHGERARLAVQSNALISAGQGREAAVAAALLGDPNLIEKAFADTGLLPEAALHAHQHGRVSSLQLVQEWNKMLQKQLPGKPGKLQTPGGGILSANKSPSLRPPSASAPLVEVVVP